MRFPWNSHHVIDPNKTTNSMMQRVGTPTIWSESSSRLACPVFDLSLWYVTVLLQIPSRDRLLYEIGSRCHDLPFMYTCFVEAPLPNSPLWEWLDESTLTSLAMLSGDSVECLLDPQEKVSLATEIRSSLLSSLNAFSVQTTCVCQQHLDNCYIRPSLASGIDNHFPCTTQTLQCSESSGFSNSHHHFISLTNSI